MLKLDRTRHVQILPEFVKIGCGVLQRSVLGSLKFCHVMIPLGVIIKFYNIIIPKNDEVVKMCHVVSCRRSLNK